MNDATSAFKVGLVVSAAVLGFMFWFFNTSKNQLGGADTIGVYGYFKNAGGLTAKSKVTAAGLDVGQIANIKLVNLDLIEEEKSRCEQIEAMQRQGRYSPPKAGEALLKPGCRRGFWAKVELRVKKSFPLHKDARVEKSTLGIMGSNVLELSSGDPHKPLINDGEEIVNVRWMSGMEEMFSQVGNLQGDIEGIVRNINGITASVNTFMGPGQSGQPMPSFPVLITQIQEQLNGLVDNVNKTVDGLNGVLGDNRKNVSEVIANLSRVSEEIKDIANGTGERGEAFNAVIANVAEVTEQLRGVVAELRGLIGESDGTALAQGDENTTQTVDENGQAVVAQLGQAQKRAGGIRETVSKLNESLDALSSVTKRIAAGEGTVGRLLTDDKMARDIEDAISGAGEIVSGINRLDTHVKVLGWYNFNAGTAHDGLVLHLQPRPDKYYLIELMNDPRRVPLYTWTQTQTDDPLHNGPRTINETIATTTDDFRMTAMFAKMWGPLTLRVGIIENSGGVGANLQFFEDRLRLRSDLYQFGVENRYPRWRNYLELEPIEHVFFIAGVDDLINFGQVDYFAGGGIGFTDDDLKSLMTVLPSP